MQLTAAHEAILAKVRLRLVPILMLCYFAAFLDRVNIGFAALEMNADLKLTATAFGTGAGLFFLGYVLCEIPSNLVLARVGARTWLARIMISWGVISACTAFVHGSTTFYLVRIALGAAEAGFFPGLLFYCTLWFPQAHRGRVYGLTQIAPQLASVVGAPLSVFILQSMEGVSGLRGWQWMFLVEACPALIMGAVLLLALPSRPSEAKFLTAAERADLIDLLQQDQAQRERVQRFSVWGAMTDGRVLTLCLIALGLVIGTTGAAIWLPQIIKSFGLTTTQVGWVAAIPPFAAVFATLFCGWNSDRTGARIAHIVIPFLIAAAGFVIAAFASAPLYGLIGLTLGTAGIAAASPSIWALPAALLTGTASAAGLALINSSGSTGGFAGPYIIGLVRDATGSFTGSLLFLAAVMAAAAGVAALLGRHMAQVLAADRSVPSEPSTMEVLP